jgi:hypothetical protein
MKKDNLENIIKNRKSADKFFRNQLAKAFDNLNNQLAKYIEEEAQLDVAIKALMVENQKPSTEMLRHKTHLSSSIKSLSVQLGKLAIEVIKEKNLLSNLEEIEEKQDIEINILTMPPISSIERNEPKE